ncbi:MAG: hypothetical protein CMD53_03055 [Gammaproteobacteria bacterium]|nr:hypothetical protein [Gammaproteobacteria bacterium]
MTQFTPTKLEELNTFQLFKHYAALQHSLPLLTSESKELVQAEMEICANLRSTKIDSIHYVWTDNESKVEVAKQEQKLLADARKHHESQIKNIKSLLEHLRCTVLRDEKTLKGKNYSFTFSPLKEKTLELNSNVEDWTEQERSIFCIEETILTTKKTLIKSIDGSLIEEITDPIKETTKVIPNVEAIRKAYDNGQPLPRGVKLVQKYKIYRKRILRGNVDALPSLHSKKVLSKEFTNSSEECEGSEAFDEVSSTSS